MPRLDYRNLHKANHGFAKAAKVAEQRLPRTYKQAMNSAKSDDWLRAMESELHSLEENDTWVLVQPPKGVHILKGRWVYVEKELPNKPIRHKARWVVKGYEQIEGIDYTDTFASVVKSQTTKILFALAAHYGWYIEQMGVVTAFLYGKIDGVIYVEMPHGFGIPGMVCKLTKALYGLKQSPRIWQETIDATFKALGFKRSIFDWALYINEEKQTIIGVYVDDLLIFGADLAYIKDLKKFLAEHYKMTDLGPCKNYLGTEIHRDLMKRTLTINQKTKIEKLLIEYGMEQCAHASTPMDAGIDLGKSDVSYIPDPEEHSAYRSLMGSLNHLMVYTRPDIAYACSKLAQYNSRPDAVHWKALKRVLRYLAGTTDKGITFGLGKDEGITPKQLVGWTDSAYADDVDDSHSTSGYP